MAGSSNDKTTGFGPVNEGLTPSPAATIFLNLNISEVCEMANIELSSKKKMLKNHIAILLDRSGSMGNIRQEAIDAFNEQVDTMRKESLDMETTVSLVTFSTNVDAPLFWCKDVDVLKKLTPEDYIPQGMTAMLDAVGFTINELQKLPDANDEDTSFLIIIISDGAENNSKRFSWDSIAEAVAAAEKTDRWTFTYLGANQNLADVSKRMNINIQNTMAFSADHLGVRGATVTTKDSLSSYYGARRGGSKSVKSFFKSDPDSKDSDDSKQKSV